jgi:Protein of unknown function (DUF2723)
MRFNKVNNITGWLVCLVACTVYLLTIEPTTSLWDTGEFISSSYRLGIPHPPGAPLFTILARFFIVLFGDDPHTAARAVNSMSAIASGFTILFLFWSITHFARKLVHTGNDPLTTNQTFTVMSAGVIGALAYTFSDSFWFSAVEGEVYALSGLFTAIVFWAILKWERRANEPGADRWLVFIFYMMGLSIGIHLLNLLTIPAIVMVYYYKRYKVTTPRTILALFTGFIITGFVLKFFIQYTVKGAGWFDIFFVNELGAPFLSGFIVFFLILAGLIAIGVRFATRRKYPLLKLALLSSAFLLIGYSTYFTTMIRSQANPGVDMFNVDNPVALQGYLGRQQYGDWPILYGPDFTDQAPYLPDGDLYVKGKNSYIVAGSKSKQDWGNTPSSHFFPRMWDGGNDRGQVDCYRQFSGLEEGEAPTMGDNLKYFMRYQAGWMYMRYFMWNFAGKQNDLQGFGNPRDSNFISGISFVDNALYGNQGKLPDSIHANNKAYNRLYMLPLLLGIAGLALQYRRNKRDLLVNGMLFLMTGMAIVVYLNQAGFQPRERDYIFAASFYAFAIWIGLGAIAVKNLLEKFIKNKALTYATAAACFLAVPVLMAQQEWNDHDRSHKTLALDLARNYLESCPPNAILFTFEDNDTYPLWYAQEVEGIRPDVRVMVNTLTGTDWYMNEMRYKINNSDPFDIIFTPEQVAGERMGVIYYRQLPGFEQEKYYDLYSTLKNVIGSDEPAYNVQAENGENYHLFPVRKFSVPVDVNTVTANGTVKPGDQVVPELHLDLPQRNYLLKNDLTMLAVIAANKWKRPVCFTNTGSLDDLGLSKYARLNGLTYQLVPVENSPVNSAVAYKNIMEKFKYGSADRPGVYFDEDNRRYLNTIKRAHSQLAVTLVQEGKLQEARAVLQHYDKGVKTSNFPYGMVSARGNQHNMFSVQFLQACYLSGELNLAKKVSVSLKKDLQQQLAYYRYLGDGSTSQEQLVNNAYLVLQGKGSDLTNRQIGFAQDILSGYQLLKQVDDWEKQYLSKKETL